MNTPRSKLYAVPNYNTIQIADIRELLNRFTLIFFFRLLISVTAAEMQKHQNGPLPQQLTKWVIACNGAIVGFLMSLEADVLEAGRAGLLSSSELRAIGDRTYVTRCSTNDVEESA